MAKVIFDYSKCKGTGECVNVCPVSILELSGNKKWCKPIDSKVENTEAIKKFHEEVENKEGPVNVVIENDIPDCVGCRVCEGACPESAISIEM